MARRILITENVARGIFFLRGGSFCGWEGGEIAELLSLGLGGRRVRRVVSVRGFFGSRLGGLRVCCR